MIPQEDEPDRLSLEQERELDRRFKLHESDAQGGLTWEQVRQALEKQF